MPRPCGEASVKELWRRRHRGVARQLKALAPELAEFRAPPRRPDAVAFGRDHHLTSLVLAEYTAIRQEIQTALSNQQSALSVGAATLGLLAAVGARFWPDDLTLGGLVFALAVPAACAMAVRMWYGELLRIARAARFIAELERWANRGAGARLLVWEQWMHECRELKGQDIDRATWRSVVLGFGALAAMSVTLGVYWLSQAPGAGLAVPIAILDALLFAREWRQIGRLKGRAQKYLALADDDERWNDEPQGGALLALR
jgi:hypothetical protein